MNKKMVVIMVALICSFVLYSGHASASELENEKLEHVTLMLLHQKIVDAMKDHYGGITQFQDLKLVEIVPRNLPADLKDDSAFKSPGLVYDIIVQLQAIVGEEGKREKVTIVLSNEFAKSGFDVVSFDVN
jgi:uncharacterized membrane protein